MKLRGYRWSGLLAGLMAFLPISAVTQYATIHNQFKSIVQDRNAHIHGSNLVVFNPIIKPVVAQETTPITTPSFRYLVRFASLNNKAGRKYIVHGYSGKQVVSSPCWGIATDNGWRVQLQCRNEALYDDLRDRRIMTVTLLHHDEPVTVKELTEDVDLDEGFNTLQMSVENEMMTISIGQKKLAEIMQVPYKDDSDTLHVGLWLGAGAKVALERSVLSLPRDSRTHVKTSWTREALDALFAASDDPMEGYWCYQDRDMDENVLRLGGRYTVALVATDEGYDIIYVDGAQVGANQWVPCELKGRLTKTIFDGNFDLMWIDATHRVIEEDASASFENGVLLTLRFPIFRSQMRLKKVLQ